jgi:CHASE3 domain sensor protein
MKSAFKKLLSFLAMAAFYAVAGFAFYWLFFASQL